MLRRKLFLGSSHDWFPQIVPQCQLPGFTHSHVGKDAEKDVTLPQITPPMMITESIPLKGPSCQLLFQARQYGLSNSSNLPSQLKKLPTSLAMAAKTVLWEKHSTRKKGTRGSAPPEQCHHYTTSEMLILDTAYKHLAETNVDMRLNPNKNFLPSGQQKSNIFDTVQLPQSSSKGSRASSKPPRKFRPSFPVGKNDKNGMLPFAG